MNTYQYNINGEIKYLRAMSQISAFNRVFFGELARVGHCSLKPTDLKQVRNPGEGRCKMDEGRGNIITDQLRHI